MKILGIVGSRRKRGNTAVLMQEALKPFQDQGIDTELIYLGDYQITGCTGCEGCQDTFECMINDDMQKLYPKLLEYDAVIMGSPTYFYNVSGDMKTFIDRCYALEAFHKEDRSVWISLNEVFGMKYAGVIAVCEQENEQDMGYTAETMERSLLALGFRVVSTVKAFKLFAEGEALTNNIELNKAKNAGEKLLKTLQLKSNIALGND